jgi:hypothetical protein
MKIALNFLPRITRMNTDQGSRVAEILKEMNHGVTEAQSAEKTEANSFGVFSVPPCLCGFSVITP